MKLCAALGVLFFATMCILVPHTQLYGQEVFLYEDFDDGDYDGWTVEHPFGHPAGSLTPEIVPSPEGYAIRGVGSGYSSQETAWLTMPADLEDVVELTIEMRARAGTGYPNNASTWLLNGDSFYRNLQNGQRNPFAALQASFGDGDIWPYVYYNDNNWHTIRIDRDAEGYWSMTIDGTVVGIDFWQDMTLTSFDSFVVEVTRNQSEIEWVRVSGTRINETLDVGIDVKPGSDRNPVNVKDKGVLPVAVLGSEDMDILDIDPESIQLAGVSPLRWSAEDIGDDEADGYLDLSLKFDVQEILDALGDVADGDLIALELTGELNDGTPIVGADVIEILSKGKGGK